MLIIFFLLVFSVISFANDKQEDNGSSWINVQYVECIKNKLPCECAKIIGTATFLSIDTNNKSEDYGIMLNKYGELEPYIYKIRKIKQNEYKIFSLPGINSWPFEKVLKLLINKDTLYIISDSIHSKFIQSEVVKEYNIEHYYRDNVYLLNKAFIVRGYPQLEQIVNHSQDSLFCACNPWIGNINLLSVKGQGKQWVLDIKFDSLYIKRVINYENSDPDDAILTERMVEFKWIPIAAPLPRPSVRKAK